MNTRWLAALLLAALALFVAGCGGDDGGDSASSDTAVVETESSDDDATETDASDDDATETDDGDVALGGECTELAGLASQLQSAFGGADGDLDSTAEVFDELAERVPEEIREDYQVLADNFREFAEALEGVDLSSGATPDAETLAKLQEAAASMDEPEVREASENIEAWVTANC